MKKQNKLIFLFVPLLLLLSGCGASEYNLVTEFGQGFWENFVFVFSWMIVNSATILGDNLVYGLIFVTLAVRIAMVPLFKAQIKSSDAMQKIQPEIKKLQDKYKDADKQGKMKMQQETQDLYKREGVNPFAGCVPMLIQMPLLFVFYGAIQNLFIFYSDEATKVAAEAAAAVGDSTAAFIGASQSYAPGIEFSKTLPLLGDMGETNIVMALLAAVTTYFSTKVSMMGQDPDAKGSGMMKQMSIMMPLMILFFGMTMPGALALYWFLGNLVMIGQTLYYKRHKIKEFKDKKKLDNVA